MAEPLKATATANICKVGIRIQTITLSNEHAQAATTMKVYDSAATGTGDQMEEMIVPASTTNSITYPDDGLLRFKSGIYVVLTGGTPKAFFHYA